MEQLSLTPARRQYVHHAYGRPADAFETVAWRPPSSTRFEPRVANDRSDQPEASDMAPELPGWVVIAVGALVAAVMGMLLGGALAV